ncbi:RNA chaperone Hfq [Granulicella cerasi]|uniref:RNA chaperone Hfq n=1 Tax=Granulicella cerasi TaxID=741063 RepID=A0ABW1ZF32_9BACT|nr:RNA chaperone Hfq [Granulicella cerasi]
MRIWNRRQKTPTGDTGQEALYLKSLSDRQVQVQVKLRDGETVAGWIEYFDDMMLRLTREGQPNLFIYKAQVRTITENTQGSGLKRNGNRDDL